MRGFSIGGAGGPGGGAAPDQAPPAPTVCLAPLTALPAGNMMGYQQVRSTVWCLIAGCMLSQTALLTQSPCWCVRRRRLRRLRQCLVRLGASAA